MDRSIAVIALWLSMYLTGIATATEQSLDPILSFGEKAYCLGNPLEALWPDWKRRPKFDEQSTANRKGYVAHWEIREARLYLVKLEKAEIDGKRVKPEGLLDRGKLPIAAEWFSGSLEVGAGKYDPIAGWERLMTLQIERGLVKSMTVERNMKSVIWRRSTEDETVPLLGIPVE